MNLSFTINIHHYLGGGFVEVAHYLSIVQNAKYMYNCTVTCMSF